MVLKDIDFANETAMKKELLVEMRKSTQPFSLLLSKTVVFYFLFFFFGGY